MDTRSKGNKCGRVLKILGAALVFLGLLALSLNLPFGYEISAFYTGRSPDLTEWTACWETVNLAAEQLKLEEPGILLRGDYNYAHASPEEKKERLKELQKMGVRYVIVEESGKIARDDGLQPPLKTVEDVEAITETEGNVLRYSCPLRYLRLYGPERGAPGEWEYFDSASDEVDPSVAYSESDGKAVHDLYQMEQLLYTRLQEDPEAGAEELNQLAEEYLKEGCGWVITDPSLTTAYLSDGQNAFRSEPGAAITPNQRELLERYEEYASSIQEWEIWGIPTAAFQSYSAQLLQTRADTGRIIFYISLLGLLLLAVGIVFTWKGTALSCRAAGEADVCPRKPWQRIYHDILLALCSLLGAGSLFVAFVFLSPNTAFWSLQPALISVLYPLPAAVLSLAVLWLSSNYARGAAEHRFFSYTLCGKLLLLLKNIFVRFWRLLKLAVRSLRRGSAAKKALMASALLGTILLLFLQLLILGPNSLIRADVLLVCLFLVLVAIVLWAAVLLRRFYYLQEIETGVHRIREGETGLQIAVPESCEWKTLADDINHLSEGLQKAVADATASEKMKTELITNVSHDLKTPLTSIIGYIDLLSQEELSPVCRDYVAVLREKSERLNHMISDLFDLSKASAGKSAAQLERLDLKRLTEQTLGDLEDKIQQKNRSIRTALPEYQVFILGDGRRLYRVLQNLIDNALKYSLEGTRIHLRLSVRDYTAFLEIANVASYEMDFTAEEITERFVRGDRSRSTEGSGLGLSIAKSFTELCGGSMQVQLDGDLFKVILAFPLAQ